VRVRFYCPAPSPKSLPPSHNPNPQAVEHQFTRDPALHFASTGHFQYHFGDSYDGFYSNDLKDYGIWFFKSGEAKVCRFELHESGSRSVEKGHGAKWNADRSQAWPLLDGQPDGEEEISLEDAADRASELGLPAEAPPILAEEGRIHIMKSFSAKLSSSYRTSYRETD